MGRVLILLFAVALLRSAPAEAYTSDSYTIALRGSLGLVTGLPDGAEPAVMIGGDGYIPLPKLPLIGDLDFIRNYRFFRYITVDGGWLYWTSKREEDTGSIAASMLTFDGGNHLFIPVVSNFRLYGGGRLGLSKYDVETTSKGEAAAATTSGSDRSVTLSVDGGWELQVMPLVKIGGEARKPFYLSSDSELFEELSPLYFTGTLALVL